jgi:hypothetical protein
MSRRLCRLQARRPRPSGERIGSRQEVTENGGKSPRLLEGHRVTGSFDDGEFGLAVAVVDRTGESLGKGGVSLVRCAGDDQDRHGELPEPVPERGLHTGPAMPEGTGQAGGGVDRSRGQICLLGREMSKKRAAHPLGEPAGQPGIAGGFDAIGQGLVGEAASLSFGRVLDACRRADEDESCDYVPPGKGEMKTRTATERVADVSPQPALLAERFGRSLQAAVFLRRRAAVPRQIRGQDYEAVSSVGASGGCALAGACRGRPVAGIRWGWTLAGVRRGPSLACGARRGLIVGGPLAGFERGEGSHHGRPRGARLRETMDENQPHER